MRISDWSSDVCSSDLRSAAWLAPPDVRRRHRQEQARPQIDALRGAIDDALRRLSPKSDRKSVVQGKRVSVRVHLGGRRILQKTKLSNRYTIAEFTRKHIRSHKSKYLKYTTM